MRIAERTTTSWGLAVGLISALLAGCAAPAAPSGGAAPAATSAPAPTQGAAAPTSAPAAQSTSGPEIRVGWNVFFPSWPLHMAQYHEAFKKAGLNVTFTTFASPPQIIEAMATGSIDVGVGTGPNSVTARERNVPVRAFGLGAGMGHPPNTFFVRKAAEVHAVKDLHGKTMAVNNYGGNYDLYLRYMLQKAGLDPKTENIIELPDSATAQALSSGQVDLGVVSSSLAQQIQDTLGDKVEPLFTYADIDLFKDRANGLVLLMTDSFSSSNRDVARKFVGVLVDEVTWLNDHPKEGLAAMAEMAKNPAALNQQRPNDFPDGLKLDLPAMQHDIDLARQFGYTKAQFKAEDIVDHTLIDEYLASKR